VRKKTLISIIISVIVVVVVGVGFYSYLKKPSIEVLKDSKISEEIEGQKIVIIENYAYSPKEITILAGEKVVWKNKDSIKHNVFSDAGKELSSELLSLDETYSHTFNQTGEYDYHCTPHPFMTGKIIVQ
jgi:amicyanin